jgi:dihydrofolate reductase
MHTLMRHRLIDEYRLWLHPLVLSGGRRLFNDVAREIDLKLADTTELPNVVVVLAYQI